ncbi:hypothetical protein K502DRAFT_324858 [Neoconidiobolus thromboides FSU 785]|nr:hypothetical protein K502DRAFT_324858 [Neoconidiobolus thromboides FSU 785]
MKEVNKENKANEASTGGSKLSKFSKLFKKEKSPELTPSNLEDPTSSLLTKSLEKEKKESVEVSLESDLHQVKAFKEPSMNTQSEIGPEESMKNEPLNTNENINEADTKSMDDLSQQLIEVMSPVILDLDNRILGVKDSQVKLQMVINRLLEELSTYSAMAHPPKLQNDIDKLINARRRLSSINTTLSIVQDRLDKILTYAQGES